jgi:hypothetical protein
MTHELSPDNTAVKHRELLAYLVLVDPHELAGLA